MVSKMAIDAKYLTVTLKSFARVNKVPLDSTEVWGSLEEAQEYVANGAAYAGQTIKVLVDGKYKTYVLNPDEAGGTQLTLTDVTGSTKETVQIVDALPTENAEQGVIYIEKDTGVGYVYEGEGGFRRIFENTTVLKNDVDMLKEDYVSKTKGGLVTGKLAVANVPVEANEVANKAYVDGLVSNIVSMAPGVVDSTNGLPTEDYKAGQTWRVAEAGTYAGQQCEPGDVILCITDYDADLHGDDDFLVIQANIDGAVTGPAAATDLNIAVFDGTTGKKIKDSEVSIASLNDAIAKAHTHENKDILDTFDKTQTEIFTEVDTKIAARVGDIAEGTTVKEYVDNAIGTGGTDSAEAIAKAKAEAIATAKDYTDAEIAKISNDLVLQEF